MMLAGVSHDLRTPLTRLKLQLALQENTEETRAARQDILEMETMLNGYLDFARGQGSEMPEPVNIKDYLKAVVQGQSAKLDIESIAPDLMATLRPIALSRALTNLISNSTKYAEGCRVSVKSSPDRIEFYVDDSGPGIPPEKRKQAFRAFSRLDEARTQNIEGVGLGLSIARDIAQLHGGSLILEDSPLGGLRATISLPQ